MKKLTIAVKYADEEYAFEISHSVALAFETGRSIEIEIGGYEHGQIAQFIAKAKLEPECPSCRAAWPEALTRKGDSEFFDCTCKSTFMRPGLVLPINEKPLYRKGAEA